MIDLTNDKQTMIIKKDCLYLIEKRVTDDGNIEISISRTDENTADDPIKLFVKGAQ